MATVHVGANADPHPSIILACSQQEVCKSPLSDTTTRPRGLRSDRCLEIDRRGPRELQLDVHPSAGIEALVEVEEHDVRGPVTECPSLTAGDDDLVDGAHDGPSVDRLTV